MADPKGRPPLARPGAAPQEPEAAWSYEGARPVVVDGVRYTAMGDRVEARDALTGRHDFEWFDVKVWRYLDVAIDRARNGPRRPLARAGGAGQPNTGAVDPEEFMR